MSFVRTGLSILLAGTAVLTASGRQVVERSAPGHVTAVRELLFDPLTRPQLQALREVNEQILRQVDPEATTDPDPGAGRRSLAPVRGRTAP